MRTETISIISFLVSLLAYSWIGFLWLLFDAEFSLSGVATAQTPLLEASKIQSIVFASVFGAFITGLAVYVIEKRHVKI